MVVKNKFMELLSKWEYDYNETHIDYKKKLLSSVASFISDKEIQDDFNLVLRGLHKKIFYNLAKNFGQDSDD